MNETIDWLLHLGEHYPDLLAIILGTAAGYALGLLAEAYFIPAHMPVRAQKGYTVLTTVLGATFMSSAIWHGLDGADGLELRLAASFAASLLSPFTYPAIARIATRRFPSIGTVWQLEPPPAPTSGQARREP